MHVPAKCTTAKCIVQKSLIKRSRVRKHKIPQFIYPKSLEDRLLQTEGYCNREVHSAAYLQCFEDMITDHLAL